MSGDSPSDRAAVFDVLSNAMNTLAFSLTAEYLSGPGPACKSGWQTVKSVALKHGVELALVNGMVQGKPITEDSSSKKKRFPGKSESLTLADTITIVFGGGGCLNDALKAWYKEME